MALNLRDLTKRMMIGNLDIPLIIVMRPNPTHFDKTSKKRNTETYTNTGWVDSHWGNERDIIRISGFTASRIGNQNQYKTSELIGADLMNSADKLTYAGTTSHGPKQWAAIEKFLLSLEQIVKLDKQKIGSLMELLNPAGKGEAFYKITKWKNPFKGDNNYLKRRAEFQEEIKNGTAKRATSFIIYNYTIYFGYFLDFNYEDDVMNNPRRYSYNLTFKVTKSSTDFLSEFLASNFPEARMLGLFSQLGDAASYTAVQATGIDKMAKNIFF